MANAKATAATTKDPIAAQTDGLNSELPDTGSIFVPHVLPGKHLPRKLHYSNISEKVATPFNAQFNYSKGS